MNILMKKIKHIQTYHALKQVTIFSAMVIILSGCELGPNFSAPHTKTIKTFEIPRINTKMKSKLVPYPIDVTWWANFHDATLTQLERQAATQNLDIKIATERLAEARSQAEIDGAALYPSLDFAGSYTREKPSRKGVFNALGGGATGNANNASAIANGGSGSSGGGGISNTEIQPFNLFQYGFSSVFDFDLWGKNRRIEEAALAAVAASDDARRAVLLNIEAEIANDYISLRSDQKLLAITESSLQTAHQITLITKNREDAGVSTALDVEDSRAQAASIAAQIPTLRVAIEDQISQIGLLLGQEPGALEINLAKPSSIPSVPPVVPIGMPSELLKRRPDIRQASATLHEATAEIGAAKASFFPDLTLSGSVSLQALQMSNLNQLAAITYAVGPELSLPIFSGGKLEGTLHLRNAEQREAAISFAKTVLTAFHQVDDDLSTYDGEQHRLNALTLDVTASKKALHLAQQSYREGVATYLQVLTAQQALLAAEQSQAQSLTTIANDLVGLYQALGGGWEVYYPLRKQAP